MAKSKRSKTIIFAVASVLLSAIIIAVTFITWNLSSSEVRFRISSEFNEIAGKMWHEAQHGANSCEKNIKNLQALFSSSEDITEYEWSSYMEITHFLDECPGNYGVLFISPGEDGLYEKYITGDRPVDIGWNNIIDDEKIADLYVFSGDAPPVDDSFIVIGRVRDSRSEPIGYIVSLISHKEFFSETAMADKNTAEINVNIHSTDDISQKPLYASEKALSAVGTMESLSATETLGFIDRSMTMEMSESVEFRKNFNLLSVMPYLVLFTGILITVLVNSVMIVLFNSRRRAILFAKKASEDLKKGLELYKGVFEGGHSGIAIYTSSDGEKFLFKDINPAALAMEKINREDIIGRDVTEIFPGVEKSGIFKSFQKVWQTGMPVRQPAVIYEDKRIKGWRENYIFKLSTGEVVAVYRDITAAKEAENNLKKSEDTYKKIFDSMTDSVLAVDKDFKVILCNNRCSEMARQFFGLADIVGRNILEEAPYFKDYREDYERVMMTGIAESAEMKFDMDAGELYLKSDRIPIIKEGNVTGMMIISRDITKQKKADILIKENIDRFNEVAEAAGEWIWEIDSNGIYHYSNSAVEKMLSYNPDDIIGKVKIYELFSGDLASAKKVVTQWIKGRKSFNSVIIPFTRKNGSEIVLEVSGKPIIKKGEIIGVRGVAADITDRIAFEDNLRKFQMAVENASDHIIITDPNGKVLFANKAVSKITGYDIEEIIGKTPRIWGGMESKSYYEKMWKTIKYDKKPFIGEIRNRRKSGEEYIASVSISPVLNRQGNILFFVGLERDITREKEVDRAKTEFVSLASHQLRTPLSIISWYTEMLLDGEKGKLNADQERYLLEVSKGNKRMIELVNALLNVSRIDMGTFMVEPKEEDIREVADSVYRDFELLASQKGVSLKKEYSDKLPKMNLDNNLTRIIFTNLLSNAVKYTPKGGEVSLKITANGKDKSVLIEVSDTGYGIPESQQGKIFTKLFRADNAQEIDPDGTGLGLYIARAIVKMANGEIWFTSKEGSGTTFYVTLPFTGMSRQEGNKGLI